ncbi:pentapeptide repeat-containing protein [Sansalvadorimonas verongulae]|uniref:pentapeptide repeat-containing protein n=1 Tax=Sansalvadorimonas verongulae TaxID=2172824 RepID=UPI0012BCB851|nr:pentapeptide repeat-containing protein [Sansalvadorimonas verongulae]MTI12528.1 hypothetical protein [Sansalvadorimonas verongulae]
MDSIQATLPSPASCVRPCETDREPSQAKDTGWGEALWPTVRTVSPQPVEPVSLNPSCASELPLFRRTYLNECQALVRRFLHKPLPGEQMHEGSIPRMAHGAQHQCRTACWIPVLLAWRCQIGDQEALNFPREVIPVLMKAALLHDSGREGEGRDLPQWEENSGNNCEDHLLATGCSPLLAAQCRQAIIHKNCTEETHKPRTHLLARLLHDADCLEVMRCRNKFDLCYLDIYNEFAEHSSHYESLKELVSRVRQVIHQQGDMLYSCSVINSQKKQQVLQAMPAHYRLDRKYHYEFADNALLCQMQWLKAQAPDLYRLFASAAGELPEQSGVQTPLQSRTVDVETTDNMRQVICPAEPARHQVLLDQLAVTFGLASSGLSIAHHSCKRATLWVPDTPQDWVPVTSQLPKSIRAQLFVVASVLGVWNIAEAARIDAAGRLIIVDYSQAGLFCQGTPKTDSRFRSTPFELEWFRNPDGTRIAFPACGQEQLQQFKAASHLFRDLADEDVEEAVRTVTGVSVQQIDHLIEELGPDLPVDRSTLRKTIHGRIAFLQRRFPEASADITADCLKVSPCEQGAIVAGGIDGYCLPVIDTDIERGELRVYSLQDVNNQPVTEAWLRLTPEITRQWSDNMGVPSPWYRRIEILAFYTHTLFYLKEPPVLMGHLLRQELVQLYGQCQTWLRELQHEEQRWPESEYTRLSICLKTAAKHLKEMLEVFNGETIPRPKGTCFFHLEDKGLPARVTSTIVQKEENYFRVRRFRYGRAWDTGQWRKTGTHDNLYLLPHLQYMRQGDAQVYHICLPAMEEDPPGMSAAFFPDGNKEAFSFEGIVRLRLPGQSQQVSQHIINFLHRRGIDTRRADSFHQQSHYLSELSRYHNLDIAMAKVWPDTPVNASGQILTSCPTRDQVYQAQCQRLQSRLDLDMIPAWFDNCRIYNGRAVYYRPHIEHNGYRNETDDIKMIHEFNNVSSCQFRPPIHDSETIMACLHSGGGLDSFVQKVRKGIDSEAVYWRAADIRSGGSKKICFSLSEEQRFYWHTTLTAKKLCAYRTDAIHYLENRCANARPEYIHCLSTPFHRIDATTLRAKQKNETTLDSFSLEEVDCVYSGAIASKGWSLASVMSTWLDGSRGNVTLSSCAHLKQHVDSLRARKGGVGVLVDAVSGCSLGRLLFLNPRLQDGVVNTLEGVQLKTPVTLSGLLFQKWRDTQISLKDIQFNKCHFIASDFTHIDMENCSFTDCRYERCDFRPGQLAKISFIRPIWHKSDIPPLARKVMDWTASQAMDTGQQIAQLKELDLLCPAVFTPEIMEALCQMERPETFAYWLSTDVCNPILRNKKLTPLLPPVLLQELRRRLESPDKEEPNNEKIVKCLDDSQLRTLHKALIFPCAPEWSLRLMDNFVFQEGTTLPVDSIISLRGAILRNMVITGQPKNRIFFERADLTGACFDNCDLSKASFSHWKQISRARFINYPHNEPDRLKEALQHAWDYLNEGQESMAQKLWNIKVTGLLDHIEHPSE